MRIEIEDLGKTYGRGVCALDRVRLTLASPSMTGLGGDAAVPLIPETPQARKCRSWQAQRR